jgi:tetratricopeptide (TPR) repeat protein
MSVRSSLSLLIALACMALSGAVIAHIRPRLAGTFHELRVTSDIYALPSPEQTIAMSLGWRAALADLIWAHVLVSQGLRFQEKRRFEFLGNYLDTINALDPKFSEPYRLADTLLTLQPVKPRLEDYDKAREILERGMRELPYDAQFWTTAGQFLAYLAPPHFDDPKRKNAWRMAGAKVLARACELISDNENLPYHCITAAGLLNRAGEREATIQFLERVLAINDDPEIRDMALKYLQHATGEREREQAERRLERMRELGQRDLGFAGKDLFFVIGPPFDPFACAGPERSREQECATSWQDWARRGVQQD